MLISCSGHSSFLGHHKKYPPPLYSVQPCDRRTSLYQSLAGWLAKEFMFNNFARVPSARLLVKLTVGGGGGVKR